MSSRGSSKAECSGPEHRPNRNGKDRPLRIFLGVIAVAVIISLILGAAVHRRSAKAVQNLGRMANENDRIHRRTELALLQQTVNAIATSVQEMGDRRRATAATLTRLRERLFEINEDLEEEMTNLRPGSRSSEQFLAAYRRTLCELRQAGPANLDSSIYPFVFLCISILLISLFLVLYLSALQRIADFSRDVKDIEKDMQKFTQDMAAKKDTLAALVNSEYTIAKIDLFARMLLLRYMDVRSFKENIDHVASFGGSLDELKAIRRYLRDKKDAILKSVYHLQNVSEDDKPVLQDRLEGAQKRLHDKITEMEEDKERHKKRKQATLQTT